MRSVCKKSVLCFLCVGSLCAAASAKAHTTPPLVLQPADGSPPSAHVIRLHERLLAAAETDDLDTVKKMLAAGADINVIEDYSKTHTPLTYASESGNVAMTRFLLAHGADPNGKGVGLSPLFWTVSNGQTQCVRILLQHGADPYRCCVDDSRPIDYAAYDGEVGIVKMLIWRMPRLSRAGARKYLRQAWNVALSKAVAEGPLSAIRTAVRAGADVNNLDANDDYGTGSPLMRATSRGSLPIMKFLLAHRAQVNLRDSSGRTALMYTGQTDMYYSRILPDAMTPRTSLKADSTRLLLQHGARVGLRDHSGMTALMYAAQGSWRATALLLAHGAQVNAPDQSGRMALHWTATLRDAKSLKVLLRHGATVNAQDGQGITALMLALVKPDAPSNAIQRAARRDSLNLLSRAGANSRLKDKSGTLSSAYSQMHDSDFVSAS
jgi:ankyrin repeat protein